MTKSKHNTICHHQDCPSALHLHSPEQPLHPALDDRISDHEDHKTLPIRLGEVCCRHLWLQAATECQLTSKIHAQLCTDGSTYPGKPSAAAYTLMEDDIHTKELWGIPGFYWSLPISNNYAAEMSAINKALRAVPPSVKLTIHTDSLSCIQTISKHRAHPLKTNLLKCNARPYLIACLRAIAHRDAQGGETILSHVRAHTGGRDKPSIGNAEADYLAKWQALLPPDPLGPPGLSLLQNELPYILNTITTEENDGDPIITLTPIHDNIALAIRKAGAEHLLNLWELRSTRGLMLKLHRKGIITLIDNLWKSPSSNSIKFMLETLPLTAPKIFTDQNKPTHPSTLQNPPKT